MKKHWMALALCAGLGQTAAMATTYKVDFEGTLRSGTQRVDCPPESVDCAGFMQDLPLQGQSFSMSLTFEIGATPGRPGFSTVHHVSTDPNSGRSYDSRWATERYADWATNDAAAAQIPALPSASPNTFDGAAGVAHTVYTSATRSRNVRSWTDNQQVLGASEGWSLLSTEIWQDASGAGFQNFVALSGRSPFSAASADRYDDREPLAYFLDMLQQGTQCQQCVQLQWFDSTLSRNGLSSGVRVDGVGRLVSITEVAAAVPEPSTYALMLAGVAAIGAVARRRGAGAALKS